MRVTILHNAVSPDDSPSDRDVLVQAEAVVGALDRLGHPWERLSCTLDLEVLHRQLSARRPDVIFNLVESLAGQDALAHLVPALLEVLRIPYTGCPTEALFLTNNKLLTKRLLRQAGLPTPDWVTQEPEVHVAQPPPAVDGSQQTRDSRGGCPTADSRGGCPTADSRGRLSPIFDGPYVVKTVSEHASFGLEEDCIVRVESRAAFQPILQGHSVRLGRACYAEQYIDGREFNVSVLAGPSGPEVLPPAEIDFSAFPPGKPRMVGYRAKWEEGSFEFDHTPPRFDFPPSDRPLLDRLGGLALRCWQVFGLRGYARVDFRVDEAGEPWILEINANPCLSPDAGFYAALQRGSLCFEEGIARILQDAILPNGG